MRRRWMSLGLCLVAWGSGAPAQVANLSRATCAQLLDLPASDREQLVLWLHGYYAGAAQRAVIDRTKLEEARSAIQGACERDRALPLIGPEARSLFLGEMPPASTPPASQSGAAQPAAPSSALRPAPVR